MVRMAVAVAIVGLLGASSPAFAEDLSVAREHFRQGEVFYRTGRFRQAIEAYRKALSLEMHPSYLFNIAQCHRQLGELEAAVFHYRLFLSDWQRRFPGLRPPARDEAEAHIRNLTRQLAKRQEERRRAALAQEQQRCVLPPPSSGLEPRLRRRLRISGWSAVGLGGAALVTGIVLGGLATARASDYNEAAAGGRPYGELEDLRSQARSLGSSSWPLMLAGAVLAAGGGSFLFWDWLETRPRGRRVTWLPYGAGASLVGSF